MLNCTLRAFVFRSLQEKGSCLTPSFLWQVVGVNAPSGCLFPRVVAEVSLSDRPSLEKDRASVLYATFLAIE